MTVARLPGMGTRGRGWPRSPGAGRRGPHARNAPYPFQHGFTIIELLVVIGVIGLLMAFLVPMALKMFEKSAISNTKSRMQGLALGIGGYHEDFREFVDRVLIHYLWEGDGNGPPGRIRHFDLTLRPSRSERYYEAGGESIGTGTGPTRKFIRDYWGNEIAYQRFPATTGFGAYYTLTSNGPNVAPGGGDAQRDGAGARNGDDAGLPRCGA